MNLIAIIPELISAVGQISHEVWLKGADLSQLQVSSKGAGDVVTQIDVEAEFALKAALQTVLPGSLFVGEETGGQLGHEPTWIVDPIDGTANFSRGYPQWSVSVALAVAGQPMIGVVADPSRQEIFYAVQGQGAWLQSRASTPDQRLLCAAPRPAINAIVSTVFPKPHSALMPFYLKQFSSVITHFGQVRRSGSMALELAYISAGRADAFWEHGMQAWDAAAGMVLLQEAGAQIKALDGLPVLASQCLAAGSPQALKQLTEVLQMSDAHACMRSS